MKGDKQFFCRECNVYILSEKEAISGHRNWGHKVIRKIPLADRIIHGCSKYGETPVLPVTVNNEKWLVLASIANFKEDTYSRWSKSRGWYFIGTSVLHPPLKNVMATLRHKFPNNPITQEKFLSLIRRAIRQESFTPHGDYMCKNIIMLR